MAGIPPIAWVIGILGLVYVALRIYMGRVEEQRRAAREERLAQLMAEREQASPPSAMPHSLSAVTSDREPNEKEATKTAEKSETVKIRCRACKALNDESATTCEKCGAEL